MEIMSTFQMEMMVKENKTLYYDVQINISCSIFNLNVTNFIKILISHVCVSSKLNSLYVISGKSLILSLKIKYSTFNCIQIVCGASTLTVLAIR